MSRSIETATSRASRESLCASLRLAWARHLLATAGRLENRARRLTTRAEDCRVFAHRHLRPLGGEEKWYIVDGAQVKGGPYADGDEARYHLDGWDPNTAYVTKIVPGDARYAWPGSPRSTWPSR